MVSSAGVSLPSRYVDPRRVSVGGMGEIYLAEDSLLGRSVALKVLGDRFARDAGVRRRFLREANAAAQLSGHPNVVTIYDVGECEGRPFIAMEYLPNGDLRHRLLEGRPELEMSLRWISEAASALDAAHARGIVHRDVKPANLLLDARCSVRVADFGIARVLNEATTSVTLPGTVMGTPGYISPEQARGDPATAASDVYSLAAVAYELVTGRRPFQRASTTEEAAAHLHERLPRASDEPGVAPAVDSVFERAMAKDPTRRYPSAEAFSGALAAALTTDDRATVVLVPPAPPRPVAIHTYPTRRSSRWRRRIVLLPVIALAALLAGLAIAQEVSQSGGGSPRVAASVRTITREHTVQRVVTRQGQTVTVPQTQIETQTVTAPARGTTSHVRQSDVAVGHNLNDLGYAAMQQGNYPAAVTPLRHAVQDLRGTGPADPYDAFANYNLGYTLLQLGRCQQAIGPLTTAEHLETSPSVPAALRRARACA